MTVQDLSPAEALEKQTQGALILDVREPWELAIVAIDGALNIPMNSIPSSLNALPVDKPLLLLCHHGMRSLQVAQFLVGQGFNAVYNIKGGCDAWARQVDTQLPRY